MMTNHLILPVLLPLFTGISALIRMRMWRRRMLLAGLGTNMVYCLYLLALVATQGIQVTQAGNHPAPFGISLVVDPLGAVMLATAGIVAFSVAAYSLVTVDQNRERFAYYPLLAFLVMGINFAFVTGDLFTLYVSFEVMLMASYSLLTLGGERGQIEGGIKYVVINLIASTFFVVGAGLIYSVAGTLNMAQLSERLAGMPSPGITTIVATLFILAFGIKAAIFPLFFWLPASYHTTPTALSAIFGGLLTKVGVYALWKVLSLIFPQDLVYLQPLVLTVAALTMVVGVFGAIAQHNIRRLLSFHIISQVGYMIMAMGILGADGLAAGVFFIAHNIIVKTALFLAAGAAENFFETSDLYKMGGLAKRVPVLAGLFLIAALALAGIPPLSGFFAKYALLSAALQGKHYVMAGISLVVSLFTLYSMVKIWHEAFWKPVPETTVFLTLKPRVITAMLVPCGLLVAAAVGLGLFAEPAYQLAHQAADILTNPSLYISAVLR